MNIEKQTKYKIYDKLYKDLMLEPEEIESIVNSNKHIHELVTTKWINEPKEVNENMFGFVYEITELDTGMRYIGIKRFWQKYRLKPLKGYKLKRNKLKELDWKHYNTSSTIMHYKLNINPYNYSKKIVHICSSVTELKAIEAYRQLEYYISGEWNILYNQMINVRLRIKKDDKVILKTDKNQNKKITDKELNQLKDEGWIEDSDIKSIKAKRCKEC